VREEALPRLGWFFFALEILGSNRLKFCLKFSYQFRVLKIIKNKGKMIVIPAEAGIQVSFFDSGFPFSRE